MPIDCDADDLFRRNIEARMVELGAELKKTATAYMSIKKELEDCGYQLDCEQHDWVLCNTGLISRVCVKCGAIL